MGSEIRGNPDGQDVWPAFFPELQLDKGQKHLSKEYQLWWSSLGPVKS